MRDGTKFFAGWGFDFRGLGIGGRASVGRREFRNIEFDGEPDEQLYDGIPDGLDAYKKAIFTLAINTNTSAAYYRKRSLEELNDDIKQYSETVERINASRKKANSAKR
jgi:hypothetical protein